MLNRSAIKKEAKAINKTAKVDPYSFTLLFFVISLALTAIESYVSGDIAERIASYTNQSIHITINTPTFPGGVVSFVTVIVALMSTLLSAGYAVYIMGIRRGEKMPYSSLFDGFAFAGKAILLELVTGIFVVLWSLLFVIPGIIAAYRYSFALYNLVEDPDIGVMEAIRLSKQQTKGYKWDLFVTSLSFIGWAILSALTLGILSIYVTPYINQTFVGYFQAIKAEKHIGCFPPEENSGEFTPWDER